jgi:hypothetical protein
MGLTGPRIASTRRAATTTHRRPHVLALDGLPHITVDPHAP